MRTARTKAPAIPTLIRTGAAGPPVRCQTRPSALCGSGRPGTGRNTKGLPGTATKAESTAKTTLPPEISEPIRRQLGVANRVLDVLVAQVGLQSPGIMARVGQRKATSV